MKPALDRRSVLIGIGIGAAACATTGKPGVRPPTLGSGRHRYEWVKDWAKLPGHLKFDNMHGGVVVDSQGRVYLGARNAEQSLMVFDADGNFVTAWGEKFHGGVHGMMLRKEGNDEVIYLCPGKGPHEVVKLTLTGEVVLALPWPESSGIYKTRKEYKPTNCAVAPNGDIYVGDGYGLFWIHHYNARGEYLRSWGGPGKGPGQFDQPHGIWVDQRSGTPVLVIADRGHHRLQIHALDGTHLRIVEGDLRLPSAFDQEGNDLLVVDLDGRLTILDADYRLVTHLGDHSNPKKRNDYNLKPGLWEDGYFVTPHGARWAPNGDLYVTEWLETGRVTKLRRLR